VWIAVSSYLSRGVHLCDLRTRCSTSSSAPTGMRFGRPPAKQPTTTTTTTMGSSGTAASGGEAAAAVGCTLRDLCADDKAKVAKLIKQVVELGGENQRLKDAQQQQQQQQRDQDQRPTARDEQKGVSGADARDGSKDERLKQLQETNRQVISHNIA